MSQSKREDTFESTQWRKARASYEPEQATEDTFESTPWRKDTRWRKARPNYEPEHLEAHSGKKSGQARSQSKGGRIHLEAHSGEKSGRALSQSKREDTFESTYWRKDTPWRKARANYEPE